ncbi:MAG: FtsX-like permease family protein [Candidatus Acidiferrales bacterium]
MLLALWLITRRQWRAHRIRVVLTTLGIALGVAVFFAIRTANFALLDSLQQTVEKVAGKSTLQVTAGESGFPENILDIVRATPGVKVAEPVIEVDVHTTYPGEGNLLVLGVDTTGDQQLRDYEFDRSQTEIVDPLTYLAQPASIMLSRTFAERHNLKIGDTLPLLTSNGRKDFTVEGIFKPVGIGEIFGGNIAVMDVYSAQVVFARGHKFDRIDLMNSPDVPIATVQQRISAQLPDGFQVDRPEARGADLDNAVSALRIGMQITSFIALLVGVYIIFNSFTIAVNQRWKEIGVLRAIGVEGHNVNRMFLWEALVMGILGSAIGIAGGYFLAAGAAKIMGNVAGAVYGVVSSPARVHWDATSALAAMALGVVASVLGAWFPARAASHLDPILALHNVETRGQERVVGWGRVAVGLSLAALSVILIVLFPPHVGMTLPFFYGALMLLGLTALLPIMVRALAKGMRPVMDWLGGSEGALAVDSLIQAPRRSSATVGALMVGLMFVFATAAYIQSIRHVMDRWVNQMINSDLFVTTSTTLRSSTYHFSEDLGLSIAKIPGVARAEDVRFTSIPFRGDSSALVALGMEDFLNRAHDAVEDANPKTVAAQLSGGHGILTSRNFDTRWGLHVGDRVSLDTPTGTLDLPIVGVVDDYRSEKGTIFMDRALYKQHWNDNAVDFIDVDLRPGADPNTVKQSIENLTAGNEQAFVYTNVEFKHWVSGLVDQFFSLDYMQLVVAVLVAMIGIVNTLVISVSERRREIGIVRAIGALRSQVRKMVLLEAVVISVIGVIVGTLAGVLDTVFMAHTQSVILVGYAIPFYFPWSLILLTLPVVIAASLVAGWWPARRAVRMQVIEAIGGE